MQMTLIIAKNIVFSDNFPLYSIQPQSPAVENVCPSVKFKIHKKLERVYLRMEDNGLIIPLQIFTSEANPIDGITPVPATVDVKALPTAGQTIESPITSIADKERKLTLERLSNPEEFELTLPAVGQNIELFIDFTPFVLNYFAATSTSNFSGSILSRAASGLTGFVNGDALVDEIISESRDENIVKATNSEIKSTNINIKGKRRTYYISDILEVRKPDGEPEEVTSRLGDYFGKLKTFLFGALQSPDFFSTRPIVADTDIYFILKVNTKM